MTAATLPPIEGKTTVNVPVAQAFTVFTDSFTAWWPHQYHIGQSDVAEVILESHEGGRWYERGVDGTECDWGRVLAWEPPARVLFTWQINGNWQFDPDPTHASEIEGRFRADPPPTPPVVLNALSLGFPIGGEGSDGATRSGGGWLVLLDSHRRCGWR